MSAGTQVWFSRRQQWGQNNRQEFWTGQRAAICKPSLREPYPSLSSSRKGKSLYGGLFPQGFGSGRQYSCITSLRCEKVSLLPSNSRKSTTNVELFLCWLRIQWRLTPFHSKFRGFFTKFSADFLFTRTIFLSIYLRWFHCIPVVFSLTLNEFECIGIFFT